MAFTVSATPTVFGNKAVRLLSVTTDGAEGNITSGFNVIEGIVMGRIASMATANIQILKNKNSTATAANGTIGVSGCSSGAEFDLLVFGR